MRKEILNRQKLNTAQVLIITFVVFAVLFFFPASAQAEKWYVAKAIPAGLTIEQDVFLSGPEPIVEGTVNGDVFIVGSEAIITGNVNGSVFVLAEKFNLPGKISGNLYVAAVEVNLSADSQIDRSLYAFILSLITEKESSIGRDLNLIAMSARLRGETRGKTAAIIGPWEIFKVLRDLFSQTITGLNPGSGIGAKMAAEPNPPRTGIPYLASVRIREEADSPPAIAKWGLGALTSLIYFVVVGGLVLWLFPKRFKGWAEKVKTEPLASAGYGILVLINGVLVPVVGLVLVIELLIGLLFLSLPSLAWTFFGLGMGMLITVFTLFQAAITFISKAIVAYMIGNLILSRFAPGVLKYAFLPLLLGLLIYVPLASIPYLGFVIGLATTLVGLGAIWVGRGRIEAAE